MLPSQLFEDTYDISCPENLTLLDNSFIFKLVSFTLSLISGNKLLNGIKKAKIANTARGILLFVSLISSETLMLINIKINKNNIETAPTYTNKYDIPINLIPIKIK